MASTTISDPASPGQSPGRTAAGRLWRTIVLRLAAVIVMITIFLFLGEAIFRVRHYFREKPDDYGLMVPSDHPLQRYHYRPGMSVFSHGNHHVRTNHFGFRGREYDEEKAAGVRRILILGDSVSFGLYREEENIYPTLLEEMLNERDDAFRYEVLNGAVSGYNVANQLGMLQKMGPRLKPDLVIHQTCINDIAPSNYVTAISGGSCFNYRGDYLPEKTVFRSIGEFLEAHSVLFADVVFHLNRYLRETGRRKEYFFYYKDFYRQIFNGRITDPKLERAWQAVLDDTEALYRESARQGSNFLCLILLPSYLMSYPEPPGGYTDTYVSLAGRNGFPYIVMREEYLARWDGKHVFADRVHLNSWGHQLTAEIIRDYLARHPELFSPPAPARHPDL